VTVPSLLAAEVRRDSARPFLTWYDDATGERIELSVATLANWAAKTANLLADEYGLDAGEPVVLSPADHWLSVVVALGAWEYGACVDLDGAGLALPAEPRAFTAAVLPQPDALMSAPAPGASLALRAHGREWTTAELAAAAVQAAAEHDVSRGARILSTLTLATVHGLDASLLVPLAAGGSVVMVANADVSRLADRAKMERATHTAGCDVAGLPRLA
jgi:acyl-CoA synthetase (AMP-forming)/AMP-acid ligase II